MVVGLLALALAFFAVGQAGAQRNGTQSGADAAALAAAQESRDGLEDLLAENILDPVFLRDFFDGGAQEQSAPGCAAAGHAAAESLAAANGTALRDCLAPTEGRWGAYVRVESRRAMGDTLLPGVDGDRATATATAVVEPRCGFEPSAGRPGATASPPPPDGPPDGPGDPGSPDEGQEQPEEPAEPVTPGLLRCDDDRDFELDPARPDLLPRMADLFTVRLDRD